MTPRLIAWASGKNYGDWHVSLGGAWKPLCGAVIPPLARRCDSYSFETVRKLDQLCKTCLKLYSESETA